MTNIPSKALLKCFLFISSFKHLLIYPLSAFQKFIQVPFRSRAIGFPLPNVSTFPTLFPTFHLYHISKKISMIHHTDTSNKLPLCKMSWLFQLCPPFPAIVISPVMFSNLHTPSLVYYFTISLIFLPTISFIFPILTPFFLPDTQSYIFSLCLYAIQTGGANYYY